MHVIRKLQRRTDFKVPYANKGLKNDNLAGRTDVMSNSSSESIANNITDTEHFYNHNKLNATEILCRHKATNLEPTLRSLKIAILNITSQPKHIDEL